MWLLQYYLSFKVAFTILFKFSLLISLLVLALENLMIDNKKNQIVMNNLSSNLYQDMLNNKLKRRLLSESKLRGWNIFNDWFSNNNHINRIQLK